jgi:hypothetical protein
VVIAATKFQFLHDTGLALMEGRRHLPRISPVDANQQIPDANAGRVCGRTRMYARDNRIIALFNRAPDGLSVIVKEQTVGERLPINASPRRKRRRSVHPLDHLSLAHL